MKIYKALKKYIEDNGLKQNVIAEKMNMNKSIFNAILNGNRTLYAEDLKSFCETVEESSDKFVFNNVTEDEINKDVG